MKTMNNNNSIENKKNSVKNTNGEAADKGYNFGSPSINDAKGWKLDHIISFDFAHNAYIKGRKGIDELVQMVCQECGIKQEDTSVWAKDIRTMIKYYIKTYDMILDDYYSTPGEANLALSTQGVGDAICFRSAAFEQSECIMYHTFDETKAYYIEAGIWERVLGAKQMTEAQYKAYRDRLPHTDI